MRITITGATGLIGGKLVAELRSRGDEVTVLSRDASKAKQTLGGVEAFTWDPLQELAPAAALEGRDAVVHLLGESVAQRWSDSKKESIRASRVDGTRHLVEAIAALPEGDRPKALISSSAVGIYGDRGDEVIDETSTPGDDFLAAVCRAWEAEAQAAELHGLRVVRLRTGVVLAKEGGALKTMLPPFKLGVGGPVAGGKQYMPWIHVDDIVGLYVAAIDDASWDGPVNGSAPGPVTNAAFSKALGRVLRRPAFAPVPAFAIKLLYGEMAVIVTGGARAVPNSAEAHGYTWRQPELEPALAAALGKDVPS